MKSLRVERKAHGLSLEELAKRVDITPQTLLSIETGRHAPQIDTRRRIEREFNCKINWLETVLSYEPYADIATRNWIDAERTFRTLLHEIACLPCDEREAFCESSIKHLEKLTNF